MSNLATELIGRQESLAAERSNFQAQWQEIAELIRPMRADFTTNKTPGQKRLQKIFDGTPGLAAEQLGAGLWGTLTNSANEWFSLKAENDEANEDYGVKKWLDLVTRRMRGAFLSGGGRFYGKVINLYWDLICFGTAVFFVEEIPARGMLNFSTRHLRECYLAQNAYGEVDTIFRRFKMSARQAAQLWPDRIGEKIKKALEKKPDEIFSFLHAVFPDPGRKNGMEFASYYVSIDEKLILSEGGYFEMPYMVVRWDTEAGSVYGESRAMLALPDVKMLNAMSKTTIVAAQKAVDPPILAADEMAVRGLRTSPGGIIYGGLDDSGRRRYEPLQTGAQINLGLELEEQRRSAVREAFFHSLMLMIQSPNMTATEFLGRQEEKLRLMGPHLGRIQTEFLDPLITRVFKLMSRAGAFGGSEDLPEALQQKPGLRVEYVSPLARAQKSSEANAAMQTINAILPVANAKPEVLDNLDPDAFARVVAEGFGTASKILLDPKRVEAIRAQRQQQQAAQEQAALAQPAAGALKDLAQAQALAANQ